MVDFPQVLKDYLHRIKADVVNFRRAMVVTPIGKYYSEKALIRFNPDGTISAPPEFAPTDAEAAAIKEAMAGIDFPHSMRAATIDDLLPRLEGSQYWEFYDRVQGGILMVQQRVLLPSGEKRYLPWTQFSDGQWMQQEPDGKLPFWKPKEGRGPGQRLMIHEGAKAAAYADKIVRERLDHPWRDELSRYEHWGMIGGALAPHRTDYDELEREKPTEVVYVCDNDDPGKSAAPVVSKMWGRTMGAVKFTTQFPEHFDVADPIPEELFEKHGEYIGPSLRDLTEDATWATTAVFGPKGGVIGYNASRYFLAEWVHCEEPEVYIYKHRPDRLYRPSSFNSHAKPFADHSVKDVGELVKRDFAGKGAQLAYEPGLPSGEFVKDGKRYINTYVPGRTEPKAGDPTPFLNYMKDMIPDDGDRHKTMRWIATLLAAPHVRMLYALLLVSETQGVGKGTLAAICSNILGKHNVSFPSDTMITDSAFNEWAAHKRLAVVHEIYAGGTPKAYNKLKSIVTDPDLEVNRKFLSPYYLTNVIHLLACSNSLRALKIASDDRRWLVPQLSEITQPNSYWRDFYHWLQYEYGYSIIYQWAIDFVAEHGVVAEGETAPDTKAKRQMIVENYSAGSRLAAQVLLDVKELIEDGKLPPDSFVIDTDVVDYIKNKLYDGRQSDRLERPGTIRTVAKDMGFQITTKRITLSVWGRHRRNGTIMAMRNDVVKGDVAAMAEAGAKPLDLSTLDAF